MIPLWPNGKTPLIPWTRYQHEYPTTEDLEKWWSRWPTANVGIVTGRISKLVVLDFDETEALRAFMERSKAEGDSLVTPTVVTPRGLHMYLLHPGGVVRNRTALMPGLDVRGDGGFVVAPDSVVNGTRYRFVDWRGRLNSLVALAPLPGWVLELLTQEADPSLSPGASARQPLARLREGVPEGQRDDSATRLAGHYYGKGLEAGEVLALLRYWNDRNQPPLPDEDLVKVVQSVGRADRRNHPDRQRGQRALPDSNSDSPFPLRGVVGKESNFHPLTAAELLAQEEPEPDVWVWEPYLPEGALAVLAAFPKVGKSTLAYALAVAVAQGEPFLGYPTKAAAVLILAVEEHARDVRRRLQRFGMQPEDRIHVHAGRLDNDTATIAVLREYVVRQGIKLLILDTVSMFSGVKDENDNAEIIRRLRPLLDMARETGVIILLVHHERKNSGEDGHGGRSIRGGSALLAMVDQALTLSKRQGGDGTHRVLHAIGRYSDTPKELVFALKDDTFYPIGAPSEQDDDAMTVLAALTPEPQTLDDLQTKTKLSDKRLKAALEGLSGLMSRAGKGVRGAPYTYRQLSEDSIPFQSPPIGEEANPNQNSLAAEPDADDDVAPGENEDE